MRKVFIILSLSVIFLESGFSFSNKIESLRVFNYSKINIIVEIEFNAGKAIKEENYFLTQIVRDLILKVNDNLRNQKVIKAYNSTYLHECYPFSSTIGNEKLYERMLAIPFMEKMTAIYKELTISNEDGSIILTLDTLGDRVIKRKVLSGETVYYIEIFDYDLIGKPADEW